MTNHQTQLFSTNHKSPQYIKKNIAKNNKIKLDYNLGTLPAQPVKCHQSTSLSISLGHAFADTDPSMPNMTSEAFYLLPCCYSSSGCSCSCFYLQSPAKIAARWPCRPPITNLRAHYNSQPCGSIHFCFYQEAQNTCLNEA